MPMRDKILLNGWWDFQPMEHEDITTPLYPETVPTDGWQAGSYLVPGFFTDHPYPEEWRKSRSGWARRTFDAVPPGPGHRAFLTIRGAIPMAQIFINGQRVAIQEDMFIGDSLDITDYITPGVNDLSVFLTEFRTFPHPNSGNLCLIDVPWGCCIAGDQAGIWQDVELEWRSPVHMNETSIVTSTREGTLTLTCSITNAMDTAFTGSITHEVGGVDLGIPSSNVAIAPHGVADITVTVPWSDYRAWTPEDPHLYNLSTRLTDGDGNIRETVEERFGFREVWIEGHRIFMNGVPQRWGGEWCHKSHSHWLRPEYVRQWFQQIKDLNCHYVRMHTYPHPEYFLDIADEMGIMVCQETALHGSGQSGWDTPELWPRFEAHIRRMVKRDRNHPSLVIWSVENEMRWSLNIVPGAKEKLKGYRELFNTLDPTRPAYHDGDTSLWNEDEQPVISRHYGAACHGMGWWDKKAPLHSGEIGRWHYASPYHALQFKGDEVFTDYALLSESLALDCCRIIELGRANEVSCLFFWNTSGLDNFRSGEARVFDWEDPASPGLKPLAHKAYESEYAWWEKGKGYRPGWSFEPLRKAFRPLAIFVKEQRTQFYKGSDCAHTMWLVNDTPAPVEGGLTVILSVKGKTLWSRSIKLKVERGMTGTAEVVIPIPQDAPEGKTIITAEFTDSSTAAKDTVTREIKTYAKGESTPPCDRVLLLGNSTLSPWFADAGISVDAVGWDSIPPPSDGIPLVIAEGALTADAGNSASIREFMEGGGNVLILEQKVSSLPGLNISRMPIETAFVRDSYHPIMQGVEDQDLSFWGDDPFGMPSSSSWVVMNPFVKPNDSKGIRCLVDSSGGDFGTGGLQWSPMVEVKVGKGTAIAMQLRISDKWDAIPVIDTILRNSLGYLSSCGSECGSTAPSIMVSPQLLDASGGWGDKGAVSLDPRISQDPRVLRGMIETGSTLVIHGVTPETAGFWSEVAGTAIMAWKPEDDIFHAIATGKHRLLRGLSNEDTCYLDNWTYKGTGTAERYADYLLSADEGDIILTNSDRSGLDILYGQGNATEWKRMPALSRYLDGPRPKVGAAMAEIPIGKGSLIFVQARILPELWQFKRFMTQLGLNLGLDLWSDPLSAATSQGGGKASEGFPSWLRILPAPTPEEVSEAASLCKRRMESYAGNESFKNWKRWSVVESPEGSLPIPIEAGDGGLLVGMEVICPEPRKFMETIGGLPSPDLQTFLKISPEGAEGRVTAWVNGVEWGQCKASQERPGYITDIDFEDGSNFVVLKWEPSGTQVSGGRIGLGFEDKDRGPETSFHFA